jgi:cytochrome P450
MTTTPTGTPPQKGLVRVPARRTIPHLSRDPLGGFEQIGRDADGALARISLGLVRPYLATHPEHVQHILRASDVYRREGMLWKPIQRLEGHGIAGEGDAWRASRRILAPAFTARTINAAIPTMAAAVVEAVDRLDRRLSDEQPVDALAEMMHLFHSVLIKLFFGSRINHQDATRLGQAIAAAFESLGSRMLLPFVPNWVPMPGDRTFRRAVRIADEVIYPVIRRCREAGGVGDDLVARLVTAVDQDNRPFDDQRIRDDLVGMFVAGTETSALSLTWLWLLLDTYPHIKNKVVDEVLPAVGDAPVDASQLDQLTFTRMTLQETLRLYPVGWLVPRTATVTDTIDGVTLPAGATVIISPYLTHRLSSFWDEPYEFRPERFAAGTERGRHRFAFLPFGAGVHQCLGNHLFLVETQLVAAEMLRRYHLEVPEPRSLQPRPTASLRPRDRVRLWLHRR